MRFPVLVAALSMALVGSVCLVLFHSFLSFFPPPFSVKVSLSFRLKPAISFQNTEEEVEQYQQ